MFSFSSLETLSICFSSFCSFELLLLLAERVYTSPCKTSECLQAGQKSWRVGGWVTGSDSPVRRHTEEKVWRTSGRSMLMCSQTGRMWTEATHFCFPSRQIFIGTLAQPTGQEIRGHQLKIDTIKEGGLAMILKLVTWANLHSGSLTSSPCQESNY